MNRLTALSSTVRPREAAPAARAAHAVHAVMPRRLSIKLSSAWEGGKQRTVYTFDVRVDLRLLRHNGARMHKFESQEVLCVLKLRVTHNCPKPSRNALFKNCTHQPQHSTTVLTFSTCGCSLPPIEFLTTSSDDEVVTKHNHVQISRGMPECTWTVA